MKKRNIKALSLTIITSIIVLIICAVLLTLQRDFGLFEGEKHKNTDYTIEFVIKSSENTNIVTNKELYIYDSREYFGIVRGVAYSQNEMKVLVASKGFYKDGKFLLNGKTEIAPGSNLSVMNNNIQITITNIY